MEEIVHKVLKLDLEDLVSLKNLIDNRIQILQSGGGGFKLSNDYIIQEVEEKIQVEECQDEELQQFQQIILTDLE